MQKEKEKTFLLFALEMIILECFFLKHSEGLLGVNFARLWLQFEYLHCRNGDGSLAKKHYVGRWSYEIKMNEHWLLTAGKNSTEFHVRCTEASLGAELFTILS